MAWKKTISEFESYRSVEEYLLAKSQVNEGSALVNGVHCRDWTGAFKGKYGRTCMINDVRTGAHRLSHLTFNGELSPDKPFALHRCNRPSCIEPKHLYAGDTADNTRDLYATGYVRVLPPFGAEQRANLSIAALAREARKRKQSVESADPQVNRCTDHSTGSDEEPDQSQRHDRQA